MDSVGIAGEGFSEGENSVEAGADDEATATLDIERTIIYVEKPVYRPEPVAEEEEARVQIESDSVSELESSSHQMPVDYKGGIMRYAYDEGFVYEIFTRPYRITDIIFEPGEVVLEQPVMSESSPWEIAAGVSREAGLDVQHLFVKPSRVNLATDMVVITDRHVYHLHLRSFDDRHMAMVKWDYPEKLLRGAGLGKNYIASLNTPGLLSAGGYTVNPELLSFDYKMTYSIFKKPAWLPTLVYDDGAKTFIRLPDAVFHGELPALFNRKDEKINYRVKGSLLILDELIENISLRLGSVSVSIEKKRAR
jgi:type IV secretion system protein VirB9